MKPAIQTRYGGVLYRSRTEARWAVLFDALGLRVDYEPEGFSIRGGGYLPDFYCHDFHMFMEVKGTDPTPQEIAKCAALTEAAECDVLLLIGAPAERFQIMWFDRVGQRDDLYALAQDRRVRAGFWLIAEDSGNWIGPARDGSLPDGPMFSGALEAAYSLAQAERFDGIARARRHPPVSHEAWRVAA